MRRYIDADKLKARLDIVSVDAITLYEMGINAGLHRAEAEIELLPTADVVEVRHGEWGFDGMGWTCSECGEYALTNKSKMQVHSTYCPHCGVKMDGERSENGKRTDN